MFDPKKWMQSSWSDEDTKIIDIAGEKAKIRRLKGTHLEQYRRAVNGQNDDSAVAVILQHGLVRNFGNHSYEEMVQFYDNCPVLADRLAMMILDFTAQRMTVEQTALEDAEKNSATTPMLPSSGDGVGNTDKTHNPQE